MKIEQIKKLADQITAKRQELESIENEIGRCNFALAATETAKTNLANMKAQRATLLADAFRANKKADTKQIDGDLSTAAEAVRVEADKALAAAGALVQLQNEASIVSEELRKLAQEQNAIAADYCTEHFADAEMQFLKAVEAMGAAFVGMNSAHEALKKLHPKAGDELRELLRNYGSLRIFIKAPEAMRGWKEPEWLGGPGLEQLSRTGAGKLVAGFRAAGLETV
jgi:predicted  nucleic acid-binding Zn-ribbon protein